MSCECARTRVEGDADANVKTDSNSLVAPGSFAQTYQYYDFPFCRSPEGVKRERTDLGEVLGGDRLAKSPYEIEFGIDKENVDLCTQFLERKEVEKFRRAVKNDYYFQMSFDDLPIWGFIGKVEKIMRGGAAAESRYFLVISFVALAAICYEMMKFPYFLFLKSDFGITNDSNDSML